MLLGLKEDNTPGSFHLYHLLCVFRLIIKYGALCRGVHLYTNVLCIDGMAVYMCPCILYAIACAEDYWLYLCQLQYIFVYGYCRVKDKFCQCSCLILSLVLKEERRQIVTSALFWSITHVPFYKWL